MNQLTSDSRDFPDPYDFVVGNNKLIIEFYGYQDPVKYTDMDLCVGDANSDIIQKIMTDQGNTPMGMVPYVWSSGNVALYLSPGEQLTWEKWSLVPVAIARFIVENGLKGTQYILLWHELGPVGYGQLVTTSGAQNLATTATTNAFPDPYDKTFASIGLTIEFYGYQGSISPMAMRDCMSAAMDEVVRNIFQGEVAMDVEARSYSYSADEVTLFLSPTENLTWQKWAFMPLRIQEFVTENEFKGTQFLILWEGFGPVGFGQLTHTSTEVLSINTAVS